MSVPPSPYGHPGSPPPRPEVPESMDHAWLAPEPPPQTPADPGLPADRAAVPAFAPWAPFAALVVAYAMAIFAAFIFAGVVAAFGSDVDADDLPTGVVLGATIVQDGLLLGLAVVFARISGVRVTPATFGLRGVRLWWGMGWAVVAFACFYAFLYLWTVALGVTEKDNLAQELGAQDSVANLIAVAFLVALVAPIAEEIFFRGFMFPALWRRYGWVFGAIVTGAVFGLVHAGGTPLVFIVPLAMLGFLLCALYRWTGSLLPGMGLHAFNNAFALGIALEWEWWQVALAITLAPALVVWIGARLAAWRPRVAAAPAQP